jgi:hypothetical protein
MSRLSGRPHALLADARTLKCLAELGRIHCTKAEIAGVLGVSRPTLDAFLDREPSAREAFENGTQEGKASLRRTQFRLAERNAAMAIFLGKNYLGQKDVADVRDPGPAGSFPGFDLSQLEDLSGEELAFALRLFSRLAGEDQFGP